jgi:amyloid beta precursor protein binding protein 1
MATSDKYDRQLRLWGSNGQRALMESNILLINADAVGTEVMKNLVLPGIGKFVVLDDNVVTEKDLGCNFFVDGSKLGKSRAQSVTELLIEMNPDVSGSYEIGNIATIEAAGL